MRKTILLILIAAISALPLDAQKLSNQKKQLEKLRAEVAELDSQIKANASKSADASAQLSLSRKKVAAGKQLVSETGKMLDSISVAAAAKEKEITVLEGQLDTTLQQYAVLVRRAYQSRDTKMWYMYILTGKTLSQTVRRAAYMRDLSSTLRNEASSIREKKFYLQQQKAALDSLKAESELLLSQQKEDLASLQADEKQVASIVSALKKDQNNYKKQLAKKQKEVDALNKKIAEMVAAEAKKSSKKSSGTSKKSSGSSKTTGKSSPGADVDVKLSNEFAANKGKLPWPVSGTVVGQYGQHNHPVYTNVALPFNNGVNIATREGAVVKAVFDGEVRQVVVMPGYNQCVLVQHGNYYTFYCKLSDVAVKAGTKIKTGDMIGHVETISGETQLHFQVWKGTASQDPELWLR